jgi:hypothetical protein
VLLQQLPGLKDGTGLLRQTMAREPAAGMKAWPVSIS